LLSLNQAGHDLNDHSPPHLRKLAKRASMFGGKSHTAPPEGFYCYYPELFDKPNVQIFRITRVARRRLNPQQALDNKS